MTGTVRVGVVGTENSHVDHIVRVLNVERAYQARVVGLAEGDPERGATLAELGGVEHVVGDVADLLELADALVVTDRHGARHREHAMPFLAAGRPVLVDKPFACGVADAEAMVATARKTGAPLTSYSPLRWLPEVTRTASALDGLGELQSVTAIGPADPDGPHGGVFFYGAHPVNVTLAFAPPGPVTDVEVRRARDTVVATGMAGGVRVEVGLVRPDERAQVPFHVTAVGRTGVTATEVALGDDYLRRGLAAFLTMVETGTPPIPYDQLVRDVAFLEAVALGLRDQI